MKRITAFVVTLLLMFSLSIAAFADLGDSDFDNWTVVCGPTGFSFVDVPYIDTDPNADLHDYLKPGTKLEVYRYDTDTEKYLLSIDPESGHKIKGSGFVYVTGAQLDQYFIGEKQAYSPNYTKKLKNKVECVVTPRVGLMLRQGPDTGYPAFRTIPYNTKLTYQHVFEGEKYNWAYVTYKGRDGWCCINYTEKIVPETTTVKETTEPTTQPTTEPTTEATTQAATEPTTEAEKEITSASILPLDAADPALATESAESPETAETTNFFGNTGAVILVCCLGAVILALTAAVVLLIIKRKKS